MTNRVQEISTYLQQQDFNVAVRRLLDVSLDSNSATILQQAIKLSQQYHTTNTVDESFLNSCNHLLQQLAQLPLQTSTPNNKLLQAHGISKQYNKGNFNLQALDVSINLGEVLGVVGENGNGKTTLLRCLAGQLFPNTGDIQYYESIGQEAFSIKHAVAFIPQRIPRWYGNLKDNLHFSAAISGVVKEENDTMVDFMLERLNLTPYADLNWNQISSGYRTRFEIARVLLQKPKLLILDEPLANLDINAQQTILTDLRYLAKSVYHPMGIILSSQQLHEVEKVADNVLFLKQGKLVYNSSQQTSIQQYVVEIETSNTKDQLLKAFNDVNMRIHFNGGFYTLQTQSLNPQQILQQLLQQGISINYYRDISSSTKRFF